MIRTYFELTRQSLTRYLDNDFAHVVTKTNFSRYELKCSYLAMLEHWKRRPLQKRIREFEKLNRKDMIAVIFDYISAEFFMTCHVSSVSAFKFQFKNRQESDHLQIEYIAFDDPKTATSTSENKPKSKEARIWKD